MPNRSVREKLDEAARILQDESQPLRYRLTGAYLRCPIHVAPNKLPAGLVTPFKELLRSLSLNIEANKNDGLHSLFVDTRPEQLEKLSQKILGLVDKYHQYMG
jgi:hypothetical protein